MKLAEIPPAYCSACFLSKPGLRHVDFDVAWDGPTFHQADDRPMVAIDDLVICEECLGAAAALLGLTDPGELGAQLEQLQAANRVLVEELRGLEEYANRMEAAIVAKSVQPTVKRRQAKVAA